MNIFIILSISFFTVAFLFSLYACLITASEEDDWIDKHDWRDTDD